MQEEKSLTKCTNHVKIIRKIILLKKLPRLFKIVNAITKQNKTRDLFQIKGK